MSYLPSDPACVLVVSESETAIERVRSTVLAGTATDVVAVSTVDDALEALGAQGQIGCVVVHELPDETPIDAYQQIRANYETVSIVVFASESACDMPALARQRDLSYLPTAVDDALARYEKRRRERAESSLFTTLLEDGDVMIHAKDTRGRHLYRADVDSNANPESVIGKTDMEITSTELQERARECYQDDLHVVETGEPIYRKAVDQELDDHEDRLRTTKVPWRDEDGEIQGLVDISGNITKEKIYERRLRKQARRIDQFIRRVAPIATIRKYITRERSSQSGLVDVCQRPEVVYW